MSVTTLITSVRNRTGLGSADAQASDAVITELLAEVLNGVSTEFRWPWLETSATLTTANGTAAYAPPADWRITKSLQIPGYEPMDGSESRATLDFRYPTSTTTAQPLSYTVSGDQIRLYPTPNGVYSITHVYYRRETQLSAGSDEPLMPSWAQGILVWGAASILFRRTGQDGRADEAQSMYDRWLKRLQNDTRRTTAPVRVRVRPGSPI